MRASKWAIVLLTMTLVGIAAAGKDPQTPSSQIGQQKLSGSQPGTDAEAVNLGGQKSELARKAQVLELDLAGVDARRKALQEQIALLRDDTSKRLAAGGLLEEFTKELNRLAIERAGKGAQLQAVRGQLEEVQKQLTQVVPRRVRTDQEAVNLGGQKSELARRIDGLELDLAGIDARRKALGEHIALVRDNGGKQSAIGGQLGEFAKELGRLAVDKAGKEAQLRTVRRQLEEVQKQLTQVAPSAPRTDQEIVNLGGQRSELMLRAQGLELDLVGIDARRKALWDQIAVIRDEAGTQSAGGGQREEFARELSRLAIDKTGKEAQQQTARKQLEEVQKQLAQALASNR